MGLYTYDSLAIPFDSLDVDKGKKVLVTKTNEFAFFRLHQKDVYLQYDSAKSGPIDKKTYKEVYRGNDYTVVLVTVRSGRKGRRSGRRGRWRSFSRISISRSRSKGFRGAREKENAGALRRRFSR